MFHYPQGLIASEEVVSFEKEIESISEWKLQSSLFFFSDIFICQVHDSSYQRPSFHPGPDCKTAIVLYFDCSVWSFYKCARLLFKNFQGRNLLINNQGLLNLADCVCPWKPSQQLCHESAVSHLHDSKTSTLTDGNTDKNTNSTNYNPQNTCYLYLDLPIMKVRLFVLELLK